ncbi:MAG: type II toxin-antitoxin system RatA family toxin [Mariprofundaceae bacterium]|nr:type II toxin-antitoxin system RatA family toxin [Mariprofundaceae bacterium]
MHSFEETRVLACSAKAMFDVVMDIERYPDFLPWVAAASVLSDVQGELTAELVADFAGMKQNFTTVDRYVANECIEVRLLDGPFKFLESFWSFEQLSDVSCKVHFSIEFDFKSALLGIVATPIFTTACKSMVHAFEKRACELTK